MMTTNKRFLPISNTFNFRHLGGYATADGRLTRGDRLFRSGWFELATDEDAQLFERLGIRTICDFRTQAERDRQPISVDCRPPIDHVHLGISNGSMGPYLQTIHKLKPEEVNCKAEMIRMHESMLSEAIPRHRSLFRILLDSNDPVLMLCSTGKDRTGVASALLLAALGVPKATIFQDYLLSAQAYAGREIAFARNHGLESLGHDAEVFRDVFTVHPQYLDAVWSCAEGMSGSIEGFLAQFLQLDREAVEHLRNKYTRDAG